MVGPRTFLHGLFAARRDSAGHEQADAVLVVVVDRAHLPVSTDLAEVVFTRPTQRASLVVRVVIVHDGEYCFEGWDCCIGRYEGGAKAGNNNAKRGKGGAERS